MDNYLPMGSLDQGLDVLQIMRNIHVFVSRFTYNMNMQQFVEYRPDKSSKHLNTIKIQSIAASIRQHGLGALLLLLLLLLPLLLPHFVSLRLSYHVYLSLQSTPTTTTRRVYEMYQFDCHILYAHHAHLCLLLGVLNTTVNFTYQFLSSKFRIFSQFLFDDYIRAHLSREHRWFKKHKNEAEINNR